VLHVLTVGHVGWPLNGKGSKAYRPNFHVDMTPNAKVTLENDVTLAVVQMRFLMFSVLNLTYSAKIVYFM
jgi:hypothetical protein